MTSFSKRAGKGSENSYQSEDTNKEEKPFIRDDSGNKLFKNFQVDNLQDIITEDCVAYYDADTLYHQAATNQQVKFITVKHIVEGWEEELAGVKVFRGLGKGIKKDSWLGMKNLEREVEGLDPYTLEDFEITDGQRLKGDHDYCMEQAKMQVHMKIKRLRNQFRLPKIVTVIGSGDNFRHNLPLCRLYKGERKKTLTPILLKELRQWGIDELGAIDTPESELHGNIETDDYVDMQGYLGALHYDKTGKYNKMCILSDKDGNNAPKLTVNPDTYNKGHPLEGKFKLPQAYRVPNTKESAGDIEIVHKTKSADYKFIGFKGLLWQILTFDGADCYNALGHLNGGMGYGMDSAFKLLKPIKCPKEALQAVVDKFTELLPYGVQYTDCHGVEQDVDTLTYMNFYFRTAYMLRSMNDTMDLFKLCKAMKIDTSKAENNNKLTPPIRTFTGDEDGILSIQDTIISIITEDLKGCKQLKSKEKDTVFDCIKEKLEGIDFESQYSMIQEEK